MSRLVSIANADENAFLTSSIADYDPGTDWWIGYADDAVEGRWVWEDGSTSAYTNWEPGQPNNFFDQDCAEIDPDDGRWNDEYCLFAFQPFVCESR